MLAEMLSMVCHPEYFLRPPRDQTVDSCEIFANLEGIVVHFDGFHACVYFATFPSEYLETLRNEDIGILRHRQPKIKLNHTRLYNLFMTDDRTEFIEEFVALLRFVAAGEAKVGHLRKDSEVIHRRTDENISGEGVSHAPQQAQDESEARTWMDLERYKFEDWGHNLHWDRLPRVISIVHFNWFLFKTLFVIFLSDLRWWHPDSPSTNCQGLSPIHDSDSFLYLSSISIISSAIFPLLEDGLWGTKSEWKSAAGTPGVPSPRDRYVNLQSEPTDSWWRLPGDTWNDHRAIARGTGGVTVEARVNLDTKWSPHGDKYGTLIKSVKYRPDTFVPNDLSESDANVKGCSDLFTDKPITPFTPANSTNSSWIHLVNSSIVLRHN